MNQKYYTIDIEEFGKFVVSRENAAAIAHISSSLAEREADGAIIVPVYLTVVGQRLIGTIKEVRACTGRNLKDAKALVDSARATGCRALLGRYPVPTAVDIINSFAAIGSTAEMEDPLTLLAQQA